MTTTTRFNDADWKTWAGCEKFSDDSDPMVRYFDDEEVMAIADRDGIAIVFSIDDWSDQAEYLIPVKFEPAMAELILNALPEDLNDEVATTLGFVRTY